MKVKHIFLSIIAISLASAFTAACSNNKEDIPEPAAKPHLSFDTDTLKVNVGETSTLNIKEGGGNYKVINEDPTIAEATVSGNTVTVSCGKKGIVGIIISDAAGNYKRLIVKSMYTKLVFDKEDLSINMKVGHAERVKLTVKKGNGNYTAVSTDENVAKILGIRNDSIVIIEGVTAGTTTVTVTDMMGLSKTVNVKVETTTIPYTDEEKKEITSSREYRLCWDGTTKSESQVNTIENGQHKMGWEYGWGAVKYYWAYVYFTGDLTVGKKINGKVSAKVSYSADEEEYQDLDVEVIKNDGQYVWGIMSVIKDKKLHYGYFCQPIY